MYLDFFGLAVEPFAVTPDPDFLYLTPGYREALAAVVYGVEQRKGFILLVGEVGTGKTTILRASLAALQRRRVKPVYIFNAGISFAELVRTLLREPNCSESVDKMLNRLHGKLVREFKAGNNFAVIIDEAQNMTVETLENLRMLSNMETNKNKLLQIVLAGQPELDQKLEAHELRQVKQRIAIHATTSQLSRSQSYDYIRHRLSKAGQDDLGVVFDYGALNAVIRFAKGNPRVINMLCDNALIASYGVQQRPVNRQVVKEVIAEYGSKRWRPRNYWRHALVGGAFVAGIGVTLLAGNWWSLPGQPDNRQAAVAAGDRVVETTTSAAATAPPVPPKPAVVASPTVQPLLPAIDLISPPRTADPVVALTSPPGGAELESTSETQASRSESYQPGRLELRQAGPRQAGPRQAEPRQAEPRQAGPRQAGPRQAGPSTTPSGSAPVEPPSAAQKAAAVGVDTAPEAPRFPVIKTVSRGDSISSLCREVYGYCDNELIRLVRRHNPQIASTDIIQVGDELLFPNTTELSRQP